MDGGAWWAAVHGVAEGRTQLSDFTFTFYFHALEEEMATHSSVLAWRTPGMAEPGGLPPMGSHSRTRLKWLSSSSLNGWALKARIKLLKYYIWNFYHHWNSVGMPSTLNRNIAILDQNPSDNWTCPKYGIKKTKYLEINLMNDMEVL